MEPVSATTPEAGRGQVGSHGSDLRSRRARILRTALVALSYLALACLVYYPVLPFDGSHLITCACGDSVQEVWFIDWTRFAFTGGHNPLVTTYLNVPAGANLGLNTSFPLLNVLALPVTATLGPVASYNLLLRLALATSAFAMFGVLRRYTTWLPAAYFGGLLFGFSPYMIGQARGHVFLTFLPLVPLFIPVIDEWLVRARANPWRAGAVLGGLAAAQFLISPEILLTLAVVVVIGLLALAARNRHLVRARLGALGRGVAMASAVFLVVAGYPTWLLLAGPYRASGAIHSTGNLAMYKGDLLAPLVGTRGELLTPTRIARVGDRLVNHSITENGFYLGIALIALLAYSIIRARRSPLVLAAVAAGVGAFVLGLGHALTLDGHTLLPVMPFTVLEKLPLLQNMEAARLSLFVQMAAAIVLAVGLDTVRTSGWRVRAADPDARTTGVRPVAGSAGRTRAAGLTVLTLVVLLPLVPALPLRTGKVTIPSYFTTSAVNEVPQGAIALTFPYDLSPMNDPMLWQTASHMRFRIFGGEAFVPTPNGQSIYSPLPPSPPNVKSVLAAGTRAHRGAPVTTPRMVATLRAFCRRYHVSAVFIDPSARYAPIVRTLLRRALRTPPRRVGGMDVWLNVNRDVAGP